MLARTHLQPRGPYNPKVVIDGYFDLRYAENPGVAFSMLQDLPGGRRGADVAGRRRRSCWCCTTCARRRATAHAPAHRAGPRRRRRDRQPRSTASIYGKVTDFIVWNVEQHEWPAFNIADAALCIGVGLMVLDMILTREAAADRSPERAVTRRCDPRVFPDPVSRCGSGSRIFPAISSLLALGVGLGMCMTCARAPAAGPGPRARAGSGPLDRGLGVHRIARAARARRRAPVDYVDLCLDPTQVPRCQRSRASARCGFESCCTLDDCTRRVTAWRGRSGKAAWCFTAASPPPRWSRTVSRASRAGRLGRSAICSRPRWRCGTRSARLGCFAAGCCFGKDSDGRVGGRVPARQRRLRRARLGRRCSSRRRRDPPLPVHRRSSTRRREPR